ncbi:MAG: DnaJ C-terminal domain-containing protein [Rhodothalassiaceae bacterium]
MKDLYSILGVSRSADEAELKRAYRKLAKELHPDRNKDDARIAERFKEVSAAYAILGDKEKRARYDRGEIDESGAERAPFGFGTGARRDGFTHRADMGGEFVDAEDLFADLFGFGKRRQARARPGRNVTYRLKIGFLDAVKGTSKRVSLSNGRTLDVRIPAGVRDGQQIRLSGQGEPGSGGGRPGDAIITVSVADHPLFRREGKDIHMDLPVTLAEAVLGAKIPVPTPYGTVTMTVPKGSSSGRRLRLKGKGITSPDGMAGDLYVTLQIHLPPSPDPELERLIARWSKEHDYRVREGLGT